MNLTECTTQTYKGTIALLFIYCQPESPWSFTVYTTFGVTKDYKHYIKTYKTFQENLVISHILVKYLKIEFSKIFWWIFWMLKIIVIIRQILSLTQFSAICPILQQSYKNVIELSNILRKRTISTLIVVLN